jgi:hypothetical protein
MISQGEEQTQNDPPRPVPAEDLPIFIHLHPAVTRVTDEGEDQYGFWPFTIGPSIVTIDDLEIQVRNKLPIRDDMDIVFHIGRYFHLQEGITSNDLCPVNDFDFNICMAILRRSADFLLIIDQ